MNGASHRPAPFHSEPIREVQEVLLHLSQGYDRWLLSGPASFLFEPIREEVGASASPGFFFWARLCPLWPMRAGLPTAWLPWPCKPDSPDLSPALSAFAGDLRGSGSAEDG